MSVNLMSAIFETEFFDLKNEKGEVTKASTAKLVLLAMADHANDEGEGAYPSISRLARKTALSEQTIRNTFDCLRHNGVIKLEGISKHGTNNHTIETSCFPKAKGKEVTVLTLNSLDPQMGIVDPSNGDNSLTYSFDPNHITKQETSKQLPENSDIAFLLANDQPITQTQQDNKKKEHDAIMAFESAFGISTTSWAGKWFSGKPEWNRFRKWVVAQWVADPSCFGKYVDFKKGDGKFLSLMDAPKIARNPDDFYTSWDVFVRETGTSDIDAKPKFEGGSAYV